MQQKDFYRTGEAAEFLHVTKMTINRWIKNGIIVPAKISKGGHNFFTKQQLIEFSNGNIKIENVENVTSQKVTLELAQESKNITK
ncbi:MAG: helix-turn-helix domain-containing protein, partial [Selenomonadaceae bacterium]|nr:helix-turn-helix domain-containing protein [Selenomonadaceae bacterium]